MGGVGDVTDADEKSNQLFNEIEKIGNVERAGNNKTEQKTKKQKMFYACRNVEQNPK